MNILKLFKGAKFDYDQIKERKCYQELKFSNFLFLTTLIASKMILLPCTKLIVRISYLFATFLTFTKIELTKNIAKRCQQRYK